jgi:protoheme ferro-lyase
MSDNASQRQNDTSLSPRLQQIIVEKRNLFEKYEQFIDFNELERLIERRGKLVLPDLALHIVRVRGQKILDMYKTQAGFEVLRASHEQAQKAMEDIYDQYVAACESKPVLAKRYEEMMENILDRLETIPLLDLISFRRRFGQD